MEDKTKSKTFRYYVYSSILIVVVFFGIAELLTRTVSWISGKGFTLALHELEAYDPGISKIYQWHPFTGMTFRPSILFEGSHPYQKKKALVLVNNRGFLAKDKTLPYEKAANEIRIATVGGSTTASIGLSFEENWPGQLGSLLQQAFPNKKITVINAGVPGFDTAQSIGNLALRVMPFDPDLVIIYHAHNDLKAIRTDTVFKPDYSHIHNAPFGYHKKPSFLIRLLNRSMFYVRVRNRYRQLAKIKRIENAVKDDTRLSTVPAAAERAFAQHMRSLIAVARAGGAKVILSSFATLHDPYRDYSTRDALAELSDFSKKELHNLFRFIPGLTIEGYFKAITRYNEVLKHITTEEKTGWVDNANKVPHHREYFVDRVHFSPTGAALMAQSFLPVVLEKLNP